MKRLIYPLMAAAILLVPSCAKIAEESIPDEVPQEQESQISTQETIILTARIDNGEEEAPDTKTQYKERGTKAILSWEIGDEFKLVVNNIASPYTANFYRCNSQDVGTESTFTLSGTFDNTKWECTGYAVYPSSLAIGGNKNAVTVNLPASYTVSGTDLSKVKVPMIGTPTPDDDSPYAYLFRAAVGVLKVTLTDVPAEARKLVLTTESDKLSGTFPLDAENGLQMSGASGSIGNSITVNFDQPACSGSTLEVYMPVPVGSITKGATFQVQKEDGTPLMTSAATKKNIPVERGVLLQLPAMKVEEWSDVGTGKFVDYAAFGSEETVDVTIQRSGDTRYRIANPYGAFLAAHPEKKASDAQGPDPYFYFTLENGYVQFESHRTGISYGDSGFEMIAGFPANGNYWNNRVIYTSNLSGEAVNVQLAPVYNINSGWSSSYDASENPSIEIICPVGDYELTRRTIPDYAPGVNVYFSAGKVYVDNPSTPLSSVKVKIAASLEEGIAALKSSSYDIIFSGSGSQSKDVNLSDGQYCLVYRVGHDDLYCYTLKDGGSFECANNIEFDRIPLTADMLTASATTTQGSAGQYAIDKVLDNDPGTIWHTPYSSELTSSSPWDPTYGYYIDIDLQDQAVEDFAIRFQIRNGNGSYPRHVQIYGTNNKNNWGSALANVDNVLAGIPVGGWIKFIPASPQTPVRYLRLAILDNSASQDLTKEGITHMAELELYGNLVNAGATWDHWLEIFTDKSYSELIPGVTQSQIDAKPDGVLKTVANMLLSGTYDATEKVFRIHSYEPYSDTHLFQALHTDLYSSLDNPTGIEVSDGSTIDVCVDQIPQGQTVRLAIYGGTDSQPEFGGTNLAETYGQLIELSAGLNTVSITKSGMAYVMNTVTQANMAYPNTTPLSSYQPVKVHILPGSGTVQGYFDPANHTDSFGADLLSACSYTYFMVKGRRCNFLMHTDELQKLSTATIRTGIATWDNLVQWQWDLMGLGDISWFNNHLLVLSSTEYGTMNQGRRRVTTTKATVGSTVTVAGDWGWGPAHEIGHANQHAINWEGCIESSNNLFSNYCRRQLVGDGYVSRGGTIADLATRYANQEPWVLFGSTVNNGVYGGEDTNLHMRMYWQLWNYYHNCGHMTDFWPKLFSYLRKHPLMNKHMRVFSVFTVKNGPCQLDFYEAACEVAQEDLTDFFEAWGFFVPLDVTYKQYDEVQYTVTQNMIDAAKERVAEKGYPKAAPFQYLEDRSGSTYCNMGYYAQFMGPAATVSSPSGTLDNKVFSASGCANAVAIEVREGWKDASGPVLFFSNMYSFTLPESVSLENNSVWAVQADGVRVRINYYEL